MFKIRIIAVLIVAAAAGPLQGQTPGTRAVVLAGQFNKTKNTQKEKLGATRQKYREIVSALWLGEITDYAGTYLSEGPVRIEITIKADGSISGTGRDRTHFVLRDLRIASGLITGAKVYADGVTDNFEAVLIRRFERASPESDYELSYGIGFLAESDQWGLASQMRIFAAKQ